MSATTLCPTCNTRFRVNQEQLETHQGLVRCGRCHAVFDAAKYLQEEGGGSLQPGPPMTAQEVTPEAAPETVLEAAPNERTPAEPAPHEVFTPELSAPVIDSVAHEQPAEPNDATLQPVVIEAVEPVATAETITLAEPPGTIEPFRKKRAWPWWLGSLVMLIVLVAEAAYFFRVELAAIRPDLKPALLSYCNLLNCTVPLPKQADLLDIESSELAADPVQSSVIALSVLLRNHAPYVQTYPNLELTLTDAEDKPLARRTFHPVEYLGSSEDEKQGMPANRELGVKLHLDTTDLKPSGYRLFLYYSN